MGILEALLGVMIERDPNLIIGIEIIRKMDNIYKGDFGTRLSLAPHENYPEILSHLEEIEKLLKEEEK